MARKFTIFALFYFVFEEKSQVQAPRGAYIRRGNLTKGFLRYDFGGLYLEGLMHGGAYFRNFTALTYFFWTRYKLWYAIIHYEIAPKIIRLESRGVFSF